MRNFIRKLVLILLILLPLWGCYGNKIMTSASSPGTFNNDKALVTFIMRYHMVNPFPTFQFWFDIWDGEKFIGALAGKTYFQYEADPGEHLFVAKGGNWSFVKANLQAGKRYYVFATLNIRPFYQNISFDPVKKENKELMADIQSYLVGLYPMSLIKGEYDDYVKDKIGEVKNEIQVFKTNRYEYKTLDPQDGI